MPRRLASSPSVAHSRRSVLVNSVLAPHCTNQQCSTSQTWGITIAGVILQNQLKSDLPEAFFAQFPEGVQLDTLYAAITTIPSLPEPLRTEIQDAFADSFSVVWKVMVGFCGAGLLSVFLLKEITMLQHTDETYGLKGKERSPNADPEKAKDSHDA